MLILWSQANIIINSQRHACLTDYGLGLIYSSSNLGIAATPTAVGTSRWIAPEVTNPQKFWEVILGRPKVIESKVADVFAFAMVGVEVFTCKLPFWQLRNEAVVLYIAAGRRPEKPEDAESVGLTDEMWKHLKKCWHQNHKHRPAAEEIVQKWQGFIQEGVQEGSDPDGPLQQQLGKFFILREF